MKRTFLLAFCLFPLAAPAASMDPERARNTVILDEAGVKNLRLEFATAAPQRFEQTIFALGRVEAMPLRRSVISSRVPGRIVAIHAAPGDLVEQGGEVIRLEGRQPGEPPPAISLAAPLAGMVTALHAVLGEPIEPGRALVEIADLTEVQLIARVAEHDAALLRPGAKARIRVPAACDFDLRTEFLRFGTSGDPEHGTVDAIFVLPNRDLAMRPGMRAEFRVVVAERGNVNALPREAVQGEASNRFVFIKDYELPYAFVRVPVVVGQQNDRSIEILEGLLPGDEVVARGAYALSSAGRGSVSLKEALDAAHGHPHNEDGSEMTPEQIAAARGQAHGHGHGAASHWTAFFAALSALLAVLLLLSLAKNRAPAEEGTCSMR
jgi:multidrug efflux pump subunit AcrA (membrane-fusion protein)